MTPVVRCIRNFFEKSFGKFYEGPECPERFSEVVVVFANENPYASRAEWMRFATEHAAVAYKSGYTRGFEWAERDDEDPVVSPEELADSLDPDWRWSPDITLMGDPDAEVPEEIPADYKVLEDQLRVMMVQDDERRKIENLG